MLTRLKFVSTNTIHQLLYNIGSKNEVDWYLNHFTNTNADQFAVIKVGGGVIDQNLQELSSALVFLQNVGLYPILVHGSGPQMNQELDKLKIKKEYHEGIRVTDKETLKVAKRLFIQQNIKLCNAIEKLGTRTRPFFCGVFEADYLDRKQYGYVGQVTNVNKELITAAISHGALPILTSLGETEDGQTLNINADVAAVELAKVISPLKIVFINETGGMYDDQNNKINTINLDQEYETYLSKSWVKYGTRLKLKQFKELLTTLPRTSSISITNADQLQRELFTHKGSGTLIRRGYHINKYTMSTVNLELLKSKLSSFYLLDRISLDNFLKQLKTAVFYCDEAYDCISIVIPNKTPLVVAFITHKSALLHDVHELMFYSILQDYPDIVWFIHKDNPNKMWHFKQSTGTLMIEDEIGCFKGNCDIQTEFSTYRGMFKRNYSLGIVGGRGYTGTEIKTIIDGHPELELKIIGSRQEGNGFTKVTSDNIDTFDVDGWILALPNGESMPFTKKLEKKKKIIVDLSADNRFNDTWQYGLPELHRNKIKNSTRISNPGCYATGAQLGLAPLRTKVYPNCSVFGVSGYSGAGTTKSKYNDLAHISKNIIPYSLQQHMHEKEVSKHLLPIQFTPHVGEHFRGILLTIHCQLHGISSSAALLRTFKQFYENEALVKVDKEIPNLHDIQNTPYVSIGGFSVNGDRAVIIVTIDNLLKGAATQCIQNMNIAFGLPEYMGLIK